LLLLDLPCAAAAAEHSLSTPDHLALLLLLLPQGPGHLHCCSRHGSYA
jgi:hypothetical protein